MAERKIVKRVIRTGRVSAEESARLNEIRRQAERDFPPAAKKPSPPGIPSQIRAARESKQLTWYAVAKMAGIPHPSTVRDIERGVDTHVSNLQSVAKALGLELSLVETET
jgi:hypothetical protein